MKGYCVTDPSASSRPSSSSGEHLHVSFRLSPLHIIIYYFICFVGQAGNSRPSSSSGGEYLQVSFHLSLLHIIIHYFIAIVGQSDSSSSCKDYYGDCQSKLQQYASYYCKNQDAIKACCMSGRMYCSQ